MKKQFAVFIIIMLAFTFAQAQQQQAAPPAGTNPAPAAQQQSPAKPVGASTYDNSTLGYKVIDSEKGTYGYDVFFEGKLLIHQTNIPGLPGNEGFKTREDALKVADLAVKKIRKGEMPPTISNEEMTQLNVLE